MEIKVFTCYRIIALSDFAKKYSFVSCNLNNSNSLVFKMLHFISELVVQIN